MQNRIIKQKIIETISDSRQKVVASFLIKLIAGRLGVSRKSVKKEISKLVNNCDLMYTYQHGCSFIQPAINKPVRISPNLVLIPQHLAHGRLKKQKTITIEQGSAFGLGDHPTTRIALIGLEKILINKSEINPKLRETMLDVGTGSGILAIAAARLGVCNVLGIDIDPCALFEAKKNVIINGLEEKITIKNRTLEKIQNPFGLIAGNLRYPTLKKMFVHFKRLIEPGGFLILSGLKTEEVKDLVALYTEKYFILKWKFSEKGWAGIVFQDASGG